MKDRSFCPEVLWHTVLRRKTAPTVTAQGWFLSSVVCCISCPPQPWLPTTWDALKTSPIYPLVSHQFPPLTLCIFTGNSSIWGFSAGSVSHSLIINASIKTRQLAPHVTADITEVNTAVGGYSERHKQDALLYVHVVCFAAKWCAVE